MDCSEIKDNVCKFCRPKNPKALLSCNSGYERSFIKIYTNEKDVKLGMTLSGESGDSNSMRINYCPICGRKLI